MFSFLNSWRPSSLLLIPASGSRRQSEFGSASYHDQGQSLGGFPGHELAPRSKENSKEVLGLQSRWGESEGWLLDTTDRGAWSPPSLCTPRLRLIPYFPKLDFFPPGAKEELGKSPCKTIVRN